MDKTSIGLIPRRYLMAVMSFFGFLVFYIYRVNLSLAIVAMTANRTLTHNNGTEYYVRFVEMSSNQI